jgi:hypothetical protein
MVPRLTIGLSQLHGRNPNRATGTVHQQDFSRLDATPGNKLLTIKSKTKRFSPTNTNTQQQT